MKLFPKLLNLVFASALLILLGSSLAQAQGWSSYHNARYGASADIPPGFEPVGPEAANSDGLIFRDRQAGLITIYGAPIPGGDFEAFVADLIAHDKSYNAWPVQGSRVTPDWAEYWGSRGPQMLHVRVEASCNGKIGNVVKLEVSALSSRNVDRVLNSLEAKSASAC